MGKVVNVTVKGAPLIKFLVEQGQQVITELERTDVTISDLKQAARAVGIHGLDYCWCPPGARPEHTAACQRLFFLVFDEKGPA